MTVTQTVRIPASRKLIIDVPPEIPVGIATLTFAPADAEEVDTEPPTQDHTSDYEDPIFQLYGRHKGIPGASVDDFLARCREDKEYELALEQRRLEERKRYAKLSP